MNALTLRRTFDINLQAPNIVIEKCALFHLVGSWNSCFDYILATKAAIFVVIHDNSRMIKNSFLFFFLYGLGSRYLTEI